MFLSASPSLGRYSSILKSTDRAPTNHYTVLMVLNAVDPFGPIFKGPDFGGSQKIKPSMNFAGLADLVNVHCAEPRKLLQAKRAVWAKKRKAEIVEITVRWLRRVVTSKTLVFFWPGEAESWTGQSFEPITDSGKTESRRNQQVLIISQPILFSNWIAGNFTVNLIFKLVSFSWHRCPKGEKERTLRKENAFYTIRARKAKTPCAETP